MDTKTKIGICKLYKGETNNPYKGSKALIWKLEKKWVTNKEISTSEITEKYITHGLKEFRKNDGTPIEIKALIWSRYAHWYGANDNKGFKEWYNKTMDNL